MALKNIQTQKSQLISYKASLMQLLQEEMRYPKANTTKWKTSLDDFQNTFYKLEAKQQKHDITIRKLEQELDVLMQNHGDTEKTKTSESVTAIVRVDCKREKPAPYC